MAVKGIPGLMRWAPNTFYKAGERFAAPNGDIVAANIDFTSGATYSATNVTASTQDGRIHALEVLAGFTPGSTSDVSVAGLLGSATDTRNALDARYVNEADAPSLVTGMVTGAGSVQTALDARYVNEGTPVSNTEIAGLVTGAGATQTALDARYVNEGTPVSNTEIAGMVTGAGDTQTALDTRFYKRTDLGYNARQWGVVPGATDVTTLLNTAAADVYAINPDAVLFIEPGSYTTTGTVTIRCALEAEGATLNYTGNGTALVIGSATAGTVTFRRTFRLPRVIKTGRTNLWDGTSIGAIAYNLNDCTLIVPFIQDFEQGLVLMGNDAGCAYNKIHLGSLWENHKNLVLDNTALGYTNENTFFGGRLQHSLTKGATLDDVNANQILAVGLNSEGGPNNNRWYGTSLEGPQVGYYRTDMSGSHNEFNHCRWESPSNAAIRIRWRTTAVSNVLWKGYGLVNVVETFDTFGTVSPSERFDSAGMYLNNTVATNGQVIPNNVDTTLTGWPTTPVARGITYDSATGEFTPRPGRWRIYATISFAPNATGRRFAKIMNGSTLLKLNEKKPDGTVRNTQELTASKRFNGSETFKIVVNQTSGADLALDSSSGYVTVGADYLGG